MTAADTRVDKKNQHIPGGGPWSVWPESALSGPPLSLRMDFPGKHLGLSAFWDALFVPLSDCDAAWLPVEPTPDSLRL